MHLSGINSLFQKAFLLLVLLTSFSFRAEGQLNTDRILSIGRNALYFEDYVLSIQYFNQIIRIKPYLIEPYYYRAIAKIQLEDFEGAEEDINEVLKRNPFLAGAFYARGFARKQMNRLHEAEADFNKALELTPENSSVFLNRLEVRKQLEKYEEALNDIDLLMKKTDDRTMLYFERSSILFLKGDTLEALNTLDRILQSDSSSGEGWGLRALIKLQMNDRKGALSDYNEAIGRNNMNAGYFMNRGILNYWEKNYRGALADYDRAIALDPQNKQAFFNRALLRTEVGDYNNAIKDLSSCLKLDPNYNEALFRRALTYMELKNWSAAEQDYTILISRYPNFVPAYHGRSSARQKMGMKQSAYIDMETAQRIEANKDQLKKREIDTSAKYTEEESVLNRTKEFDATGGADLAKSKYDNKLRGTVQNRFANVTNERNFVMSYYVLQESSDLRKTERYYDFIAKMNQSGSLPAKIKLTNKELSLTTQLIEQHNRSINKFSRMIQQAAENPMLYFGRGIDFALIQDFNSAIEDFSRAILLDADFSSAYFCRANLRFKQLERMVNDEENTIPENESAGTKQEDSTMEMLTKEKKYAYDFELIMRDYDQVIRLTPDFEYAWFNRANLLCTQKDFRSAIQNYTNAIRINPEFAEAYFNRGLTLIFIGETKNGLADLSKAGELGLYQSYNLLKRLK